MKNKGEENEGTKETIKEKDEENKKATGYI